MNDLAYTQLAEAITNVYTHIDDFQFDKHVPAFTQRGAYVGDFFNMTILESCKDQPPIFYHVFSPYDVVSKRAPEHAAVFQAGELRFNADVTQYVKQRTGVMTPILLGALGVEDLRQRSILFVGTGGIAQCALAALKELGGLDRAAYVNSGREATAFTELAGTLGVAVARGNLKNINEYDVIICHANAAGPILTAEMQHQLKQGTIITTFASEDHSDIAPEFYDPAVAEVIVDWPQTLDEASELKVACDVGVLKREEVLTLGELLRGERHRKLGAKYTIYRSHGTPMQDLAFLKLLLARHS